MGNTKENNKKVKIILILAIVCFVLAAAGVTFYFCYRVEQVTDRMIVELGDEVSEDLFDYITGMDWAVERSKLDLSGVKQDCIGEYEAVLTHGWQKFSYEIVIRDTTPPELVLKEEQLYLKVGDGYPVGFFVMGAEDISGSVVLSLSAPKSTAEVEGQVSFAECGTFNVGVVAEDSSGNFTRDYVEVVVDTAPTIMGMTEYYMATGSEVDYLAGITAEDTVDGDVSDTLTVNLDRLDVNTAGDYEIIYTAVDDYGLVTEAPCMVHVMEKPDLQETINTHQINRHDNVIVGAYNLYDAGYYPEDNVDFIREVMEPAIVVVQIPSVSRGSGFILDISDEYVLICTNYHVVKKHEQVTIYFHEGSQESGTVIATDKTNDIALIEVPRTNISEELMDTLITVHINMGYWQELENNESVSLCFRCLNENGTIWKEKDGIMLEKEGVSELLKGVVMTKADLNVFSGSSGSAIFDGYGNLIAMIRGYEYRDGKNVWDWGVRLPDILALYELTMGRQLNYQ